MIDTYLAQATSDYNNARETLSVEVYDAVGRDTEGSGTGYVIDVEDIPAVADYKEGEFMLVTISDGDIQTVSDVEILSDATVTKFSIGGAHVSKITADGTEYEGAAVGYYDVAVFTDYDNENLTDKTYNIYLDEYGYAIGVDLYSGAANYQARCAPKR